MHTLLRCSTEFAQCGSRNRDLRDATSAMIGAMTENSGRRGLQVMPAVELPENGPVPANEEPASEDDLGEDTTVESVENGQRLIDRLNPEAEGLRAWKRRSRGPSTVVRATKPDPSDLPDDFPAMTGTYSSIRALRIKVEEFRTSADLTPDEKRRVSAAAWYVEQDVRALCQEFDDLACGISISPDCFIVVHVVPD